MRGLTADEIAMLPGWVQAQIKAKTGKPSTMPDVSSHHPTATKTLTDAVTNASAQSALVGKSGNGCFRSKAEKVADAILSYMQQKGLIASYQHEGITLLLAPMSGELRGCRYTPDFVVVRADGAMKLIEVKGRYRRDDAMIKLKLAGNVCRTYGWGLELWTVERGNCESAVVVECRTA